MRLARLKGIIIGLLLGSITSVIAEEITLVTYYPAPRGVYEELRTTGTTALATQSGSVGIGTSSPNAILHVSGTPLIVGAGESGTPLASIIRGAAASGMNMAGANLTIDASNGTGTGGSGGLLFRTAPPAASGSTANTLETRLSIDNAGNLSASSATSWTVPSAAGAAPTADGDLRYDTTKDAFVYGGNTGLTSAHVGVVNVQNGGNTISASAGTTETNFTLTWTIPANFLTANKVLRVTNGFEINSSAASPPLLTVRVRLGTTNVYQTGSAAPALSETNRGFILQLLIVGTGAPAAAANVYAQAVTAGANSWTTNNQMNQLNNPATGVATNGPLTIQTTAQWNATTAGNSLEQQFFMVEVLN